uniref:NADH dehydrogenase subunit 11 n=1 Tax=Navicula tsukamotoi TaxID=2018706 RepID=UPI0020286854|nr:NADH dehydrogenase subunit 11 [Navicula tsukamotoi]QYB23115.1 NADH dehydrogenase subunit 11 [Navicula tsukamotoi]
MGALTLKSFPFILRSWNVQSFESFDPTDSFGQNTRVYIHRNQAIKIEPQFSDKTMQSWLTDKGRLFFDSFFETVSSEKSVSGENLKKWDIILKNLNRNLYVFSACNLKYATRFFFVLVFENVSNEVGNFLSLFSQVNSLIRVKRAENQKLNLNLETNFQINSSISSSKLSASSLCLLLGTNPRYEGSLLNLKLRQRYLKGNFKILVLGSLIDLTFSASFLGSNSLILKSIAEGNNTQCMNIINASNPMVISSSEALKHNSVKEFFHVLKYSNVLTEVWNGLNVLNSSLFESSLNYFSRFTFLTLKDLISFNSFYALNVNLNNIPNLKVLMKSRLLHYKSSNKFLSKRELICHSNCTVTNFGTSKKFVYVSSSGFFENQETFITTEGFRKISSKLILKKNSRSDWQVLRKLAQNFLKSSYLSCLKDNKCLFYESNSLFDFKNFINFIYQVTQNLTNLNEYLLFVNRKFVFYRNFSKFKSRIKKSVNKKIKYWIDDFYVGGKDNFCQNSVTLIRSSSNYKVASTNFF